MAEYKRLNMAALKFSDRVQDMSETLDKMPPLALTKDMFNENGVLKVKSVTKKEKEKCVKLEIS